MWDPQGLSQVLIPPPRFEQDIAGLMATLPPLPHSTMIIFQGSNTFSVLPPLFMSPFQGSKNT